MADAAVLPSDTANAMETLNSLSQPSGNLPVVEPLPNPHFVFPPPSEATITLPSMTTETSNKRPASMQLSPEGRHASNAFQRKSAGALPEFSFNPAGPPQSSKASATPPASPTLSSPATPSRNAGHRRRGSEFIGGDGKTGGQAVLSSSPVKDAGGLFPPGSPNKSGPPAHRARHAHRRSAALSSHDLSNLMQPAVPNPSLQQSSAPTTPSLSEVPPRVLERRASQPAISLTASEQRSEPSTDNSPPSRPNPRARVGFSDTVEFIPRPLSTISSETESSISTVRGHSVSGSISSVISSSPSPQSARKGRPSLSTTFEDEKLRPKSAGTITNATNADVFASQSPTRRPASFSSTNNPMFPPSVGAREAQQTAPKKKGLFGINIHQSGAEAGNGPESPTNKSSVPSKSERSKFRDSDDFSAEEWRTIADARRNSPPKKHVGKPRKVKSWANSIVPKKSKARSDKPTPSSRRPATPSHERIPPSPTVSEPVDLDGMVFEGDFNPEKAVTIVSEPASQITANQRIELASWKPRKSPESDRFDATKPQIDLDAALGPFGSLPSPTRSAGLPHRKLHSSRLARDFVGPGMHYHRRAESAPELVPFEQDYSDRGSSSGMADVFEEEEDADDGLNFSSGAPSPAMQPRLNHSEEELAGIGIQVVDADQPFGGAMMDWGVPDGLGLQTSNMSRESSTGHSTPTQSLLSTERHHQRSSSLLSETIMEEVSPIEVVEDHEEPRDSSQPRSSDSTVTSLLDSGLTKQPQPKMAVPPLRLSQQALRTPASFSESSISSPGLTPSRSSFETPRLGTATSSANGSYRSSSVAFGEPPPIRQSIEDVPSLTSSRSTMTSAVQPQHAAGLSSRTLGERSTCPSEDSVTARRRKRSSIASLSRLVGSSFGEKSKLSIEQRPQTEGDDTISSQEAKQKKKKENRLSRMMHFWKSRHSTHS